MSRVELWILRRFVKKCRDRPGRCGDRCPYFRGDGKTLTPCRIGMPWSWQLEVKK